MSTPCSKHVDAMPEEATDENENEPPSADVDALHRRLAEQADEVIRLNDMLSSKTAECAELAADRAELVQQNKSLYEKLSELTHNYKLVSDFYDAKVAQNQTAQLKKE